MRVFYRLRIFFAVELIWIRHPFREKLMNSEHSRSDRCLTTKKVRSPCQKNETLG